MASASATVPVGLLGLAMNTTRVFALMALRIASRSNPLCTQRHLDEPRTMLPGSRRDTK